jgi:phosphatidylserine/phosphatidylglycerophosphate/cardiolipin synthase-like enzyme
LECLVGVHFTEGNAVTVLRNGDEIFPAMLEAIRKARHRADAAAYPAACSMCCRRRRSGSGFRQAVRQGGRT